MTQAPRMANLPDDTARLAGKRSSRLAAQALRSQLSPAERNAASQTIASHLLAHPALTSARVVAVYAAMRDELSIDGVATELRARGVATVYPRVVRGSRVLSFYYVSSPDELMAGTFDVPEPAPDCEQIALTEIDTALVPGLAFDREGGRVGWGQGYYDHTLQEMPNATRVAVAFECQVLGRVPVGPADQLIHHLVTERGATAMGNRR